MTNTTTRTYGKERRSPHLLDLWQIGSQVPLLHIGPCSPFSLTRAARNLESFPHGPSLKLYFMTEVIQFPITSSTPSLTQKERFPIKPAARDRLRVTCDTRDAPGVAGTSICWSLSDQQQ
eukprot:GHVU01146848.1.p1 GENE.GHVU01146848.1~~GHVU01146848.1.p1  ORF type:complete len:120 (+),score=2.36 GHVU01146848.1:356-715(+)